MNAKRLRELCNESYKTINKLNPNFMSDLLKLRSTNRHFRLIIVFVNIYALFYYVQH